MKITVIYRDPAAAPDVFQYAEFHGDHPSVVVIREQITSYGQWKITRIPWDLIQRVETDDR